MTSIDLQTRATSTDADRTSDGRRKAVLFCPVCGHESPADGNWVVTDVEQGEQFTCPECEATVALR